MKWQTDILMPNYTKDCDGKSSGGKDSDDKSSGGKDSDDKSSNVRHCGKCTNDKGL